MALLCGIFNTVIIKVCSEIVLHVELLPGNFALVIRKCFKMCCCWRPVNVVEDCLSH